jgi:hypothetical protein
VTEEEFERHAGDGKHPEGCVYGGFSCGYWAMVPGCERSHWEKHLAGSMGFCPCGFEFPGAANQAVFFDASSPDE